MISSVKRMVDQAVDGAAADGRTWTRWIPMPPLRLHI